MRCGIIFLTVFLLGSTLGSPAEQSLFSLRQVDIFANIRQLIENLVGDLRLAAADALQAVQNFESGLLEQAELIRLKTIEDLQKLRDRVNQAIQNVADKISDSGLAMRECIDTHRENAYGLLNGTMAHAMSCVDERISEIRSQIENLKNRSQEATAFADNAINEMHKCVEDNSGYILNAGACLGTVALKAEARGAVFMTQNALSIGRLNLAVATVPAALEVCVGTSLASAGLATGKIIMDIGTCSATSVYSTIVSNTV